MFSRTCSILPKLIVNESHCGCRQRLAWLLPECHFSRTLGWTRFERVRVQRVANDSLPIFVRVCRRSPKSFSWPTPNPPQGLSVVYCTFLFAQCNQQCGVQLSSPSFAPSDLAVCWTVSHHGSQRYLSQEEVPTSRQCNSHPRFSNREYLAAILVSAGVVVASLAEGQFQAAEDKVTPPIFSLYSLGLWRILTMAPWPRPHASRPRFECCHWFEHPAPPPPSRPQG